VYIYFEAKVEKFSGQGPKQRTPQQPHVVVHGSVYGGIQVGTQHSDQTINVQALQVDESISKLKGLLQSPLISDLGKEEAELAFDRISQLARKEKTAEVVKTVSDKLTLVRGIFGVAKDLAELAAPYLATIAQSVS
jgi:hypothetical protein